MIIITKGISMSDTYVYSITQENPETIYINLTNKCTNNCVFCIRRNEHAIKGDDLWLSNENITFDMVKSQLEKFTNFKEVVFCGYGEPTIKLDLLKEVAKYLKSKFSGIRIRINTNGQGNLINNATCSSCSSCSTSLEVNSKLSFQSFSCRDPT